MSEDLKKGVVYSLQVGGGYKTAMETGAKLLADGERMSDKEFDEQLQKMQDNLVEQATKPETILEEAIRITGGDRMTTYGKPTADFERIAGMWNILFGGKAEGPFKPADVALAMCCVKLSRQSHSARRDNWVDLAGYSHCGAQCDEAAGQ